MRYYLNPIKVGFFIIALNFSIGAAHAQTDVCSEGVGVPPFLDAGANANILLVLDNSGSMLDMAYLNMVDATDSDGDPVIDEEGNAVQVEDTKCFDDSYKDYVAPPADPEYVSYVGIYEPDTWYTYVVNGIPFWKEGQSYSVDDIVQENDVYYKATELICDTPVDASCESTNESILSDTGILWVVLPVTSWQSSTDYNSGDMVSHNGVIYRATAAGTSSETSIYDDNDDAGAGLEWEILDDSAFVAVGEGETGSTAAMNFCDTAEGTGTSATATVYKASDLCVTVDTVTINTEPVDYLVTAFAARGNFLNWASSSKFDIQKFILGGGKYDHENDRLVSENRGCAESRYVKQVEVASLDTAGNPVAANLVLAVSGPLADETDDSTDDTTRISIIGIDADTETGFVVNVEGCQDVVDEFATDNPSLGGGVKPSVDQCFKYKENELSDNPLADEINAFNQSWQNCWYLAKHEEWKPGDGSVSRIQNSCKSIYLDGQPSITINPWDRAYVCYGEYDVGEQDVDRNGYVGRCWEPAGIADSCKLQECYNYENEAEGWDPDDWPEQSEIVGGGREYNNPFCGPPENGTRYVYRCYGNFNANKGTCTGAWRKIPVDADEDENYALCYGDHPLTDGLWTDDNNLNDEYWCADQALKDFCGVLQVSEVVDPSDQVSETSVLWNIPSILIDSAVVSYFGTERPLATIRGVIKQDTAPQGIIHEVADLYTVRLGLMAFNNNGADTECSDGTVAPGIEKFCPEANRDGAQVIAPINYTGHEYEDGAGNVVTDQLSLIITQLNQTRATSWTPLAEAIFNALGYFGQNPALRLVGPADVVGDQNPDFYIEGESSYSPDPWLDPVEAWCQENHIIVITEGASTADINERVEIAAGTYGDTDTEGTDGACTDGLDGSTYLDDLTWFGQNSISECEHGAPSCDPDLFYELLPTNRPGPESPEFAKKPITTHFITAGSLRNEGTGECNPTTLMSAAAENGDATLLRGEDPEALKDHLLHTLYDILNRSSAGSAASVIASSKSGVGAVYQAVFWPKILHGELVELADGTTQRVNSDGGTLDWVGDVHSFFIDDYGRMWDDYSASATVANGVGTLWSEDINGDGINNEGATSGVSGDRMAGDRRVWFYYSDEGSRICFREPERDPASQCMIDANAIATDDLYPEDCPPTICPASDYIADADEPAVGPLIQDFKYYLWSAEKRLEQLNDLTDNRGFDSTGWLWDPAKSQRYIFTWNDLNNDGVVNDGNPATSTKKAKLSGGVSEIISLDLDSATDWLTYSPPTGEIHHDIIEDFRVADATELSNFIKWLRGDDLKDSAGDYMFRCRGYPNCYNPADGTTPVANQVWMLGDIVHSTPKLVAQPAEAFTIYADATYANFIKKYRYRRNMVYFGSNDGMLHAVNAGFPIIKKASDTERGTFQYWTHLIGTSSDDRCYYNVVTGSITNSYSPNTDLACTTGTANGPALGDEMWAYLPYNLIPHVRCRANEDCDENHKYGVDKEPRIFDMQIFPDDDVHPGGWGTILVGAMRFGGSTINVEGDASWTQPVDDPATAEDESDKRQFISSYFVLDITDPERPPVLLGEMTRTTDLLASPDAIKNPKGTDLYADLGFSTPMPTGVVMRSNGRLAGTPATPVADTTWYLVFGNGPKTLKGQNDQQGFLFVLPMTWLTEANNERAFRVVNKIPENGVLDGGGIIELPKKRELKANGTPVVPDDPATTGVNESQNIDPSPSFVSDMIAVDLDLTTETSAAGGLYKTDAVYFGTVDGTSFKPDIEPTHWDPSDAGGGRLLRLVTRDPYTKVYPQTGTASSSINHEVYDYQNVTGPWQWYLTELIDAGAPVVGAPSVGWDNSNFWIYFGTGRFFATEDKPDDRVNYFFGLKEPLDEMCGLSWNTITWDPDSWYPPSPTSSTTPQDSGMRGLYRSDYILVPQYEPENGIDAAGFGEAAVYCDPDATAAECNLGVLSRDIFTTGTIDSEAAYPFVSLRSYIEGTPRVRTPLRNIATSGTATDSVYIKETCEFDGDIDDNNVQDPATFPGMGYAGIDGWFRKLRDPRERVLGQSALLGGLITFSSFQPFNDECSPEGFGNLYGVHYQTGTAWYEDVFGTTPRGGTGVGGDPLTTVNEKYVLGRGLATTPSLHTSTESTADAKAIIQSSTGSILEIDQENLPLEPPQAGRVFWKDDENPQVLPDP